MGSSRPEIPVQEPALSGLLAELVAGAAADAAERQTERSQAQLEIEALSAPPALDALAALSGSRQLKIIAEVKRASPSRGDLADIPEPGSLAAVYETSGASAISVLTESRRFKGSLEDLTAVRSAVALPVLRKDFISTEYQVLEARAAGADLILLMVSVLDQKRLRDLKHLSESLGMTPLVEVHSREEMARAADVGARLIGVNARDMRTFELDRELFSTLAPGFPADAVKVAESAVRTPADVARYRESGADAILIGEALVTSDPASTLRSFLEVE
ncbi:MAG: indole-3-glycerol phosphate synthase TrpC [Cryobacterium sp.]|nr:indole-3-glycerol phosphate synthase TrpC [Cryobacterium sp.]MBX3090551.1 indole-3-glycerol phosphate synthase TrpC [Cryobacterium sp.]MBX3115837.1 indole-3-glycerol phosphate synthase TrpC [Cryobacterium sp.]MCO5293942.1 indole-3-glycerol phosphate synthase TrpC [Homoserinimonas sp.]